MATIWFITGSSRGLGRSLDEAALAHGHQVAATARRPEQLVALVAEYGDCVLPLALDVTNPAQIAEAGAAAVARFGRLNVVVNNAGFGITGAAEAYTEEQVRSQLETNLLRPHCRDAGCAAAPAAATSCKSARWAGTSATPAPASTRPLSLAWGF